MARVTDVDSLWDLISDVGRVVVVTGAGVSTGSGIPDFASVDAKWTGRVSRQDAMTIDFFEAYPAEFWGYYKELFAVKVLNSLVPCGAHKFLVELEDVADVQIFTQNVDGLHSAAGSSNVVELHGNARGVECLKCELTFDSVDYLDVELPLCHGCGGVLKPTVVLFGERSPAYEQMWNAYNGQGVALFMGTSLTVAPISLVPYHLETFADQFHRIWWNNVIDERNEFIFHQVLRDDFSILE